MEVSINFKGIKEGTTIGDLQKLEKHFNSIFESDVINLKCINGEQSHLSPSKNDSCSSAQKLIEELEL